MMEERIMQLEAQMRLVLGLPVIMDAHNEKVAADTKAKNDADARLAARQKAIAGKTPAEIVEMDRVEAEKAGQRGTFDARGFVRGGAETGPPLASGRPSSRPVDAPGDRVEAST